MIWRGRHHARRGLASIYPRAADRLCDPRDLTRQGAAQSRIRSSQRGGPAMYSNMLQRDTARQVGCALQRTINQRLPLRGRLAK
jgi:hypothetical protein